MSSGGHIRQRSLGSWEIRFPLPATTDGARKVGTKTIRGSKADARRALRETMGQVDRGEHVEPAKITVEQLLAQRIEAWHAAGKITGRTRELYLHLAKLARSLADVPVQKLGIVDIENWHLAMRHRGLAVRTVRVAHQLLARALQDAMKRKLVNGNVARDQGAPAGEPPGAIDVPKADEVQSLLVALVGDPWYCPVIVALYTGMRRGEQLALRWSAVDLDGQRLHVREALDETETHGVRTKGPKSAAGFRTISLPEIVVETLRDHRREQLERCLLLGTGKLPENALVFPAEDGGLDIPSAFSNRWARKAVKLGHPEISWHALRHAHASQLISLGRPITEVAARLGHGDPSITLRVYARLFNTDDTGAAAALDQALR